jgi:hypothetical protein
MEIPYFLSSTSLTPPSPIYLIRYSESYHVACRYTVNPDILRFATIMYLKELGFIGKRKAEAGSTPTLKSKPEGQSP